MNYEIDALKLPRGNWQKLIQEAIPAAKRVICSYPDERSVHFELFGKLPSSIGSEALICTFKMSFMYGCRGILITHSMVVSPEFRGIGIGKRLQAVKQKIAKDLKVSALIGTVRDDNDVQKKIFKEWGKVGDFDNVRTGNKIGLYFKKIINE